MLITGEEYHAEEPAAMVGARGEGFWAPHTVAPEGTENHVRLSPLLHENDDLPTGGIY